MAKFLPHFRLAEKIGGHEFDWAAATVRELLDRGEQEHGSIFWEELKTADITVNGRSITYLSGLDTPVSEQDTVCTILTSDEI